MDIQNVSRSGQWKCSKCNTWCVIQASRCSWCGAGRPDNNTGRHPSSITESSGTPTEIRKEQEILNKIRLLSAKLSLDQKQKLLTYIEETFK